MMGIIIFFTLAVLLSMINWFIIKIIINNQTNNLYLKMKKERELNLCKQEQIEAMFQNILEKLDDTEVEETPLFSESYKSIEKIKDQEKIIFDENIFTPIQCSSRLHNALERSGLLGAKYYGDISYILSKMSTEEIITIKNLGKLSHEELKSIIDKYNISPMDEDKAEIYAELRKDHEKQYLEK